MKKIILKTILFLILGLIIFCNQDNKIISYKKTVLTENKSVTVRDLSILSSLVYEPVPDDSRYQDLSTENDNCSYKEYTGENGNITVNGKNIKGESVKLTLKQYSQSESNCIFKNGGNGYLKGFKKTDGNKVIKYIEGMSRRKLNLVTTILTAKAEPGPSYYFLNAVNDSEYSDWIIDHYATANSVLYKETSSDMLTGAFDSITFKRGNDYVVSFRGTDFQDALDWAVDLLYAFDAPSQAQFAYKYAQSEYKRIVDKNANANIYITGHSLGGYLSQIATAGIANLPDKSNFERTVYFNGMGINFFGGESEKYLIDGKNLSQIGSSLIEIASAKKSDGCTKLSWSDDICSSGKLVLYRTENDPISSLGLHYGELYQTQASLEAINNHYNFHSVFDKNQIDNFKKKILINTHITKMEKLNEGYSKNIKEYINENVKTNSDFSWASTYELSSSYTKLITAAKELQGSTNNEVTELNPNDRKTDYIGSLTSLIPKLFKKPTELSLNENSFLESVFEGINVAHETDSLTCIGASNDIKLTIIDANRNEEKFYTNNPNAVRTLSIDGCAYGNYLIETYNNDKYETKSNSILLPAINDNAVKTGESKEFVYKVTTNSNTSITPLKLNVGENKYEYINDTQSINDTTNLKTKKVTLVVDKKSPVCSFKENVNSTIIIDKNKSKSFVFNCDEDVNVEISTKPNNFFGFSLFDSCYTTSYNSGIVNVTSKNKLLCSSNQKIIVTSTDYAGNKTTNIIEVKR